MNASRTQWTGGRPVALGAALAGLLAAGVAWAGTPTWSQIVGKGWTHHTTREHDDAGKVEVYAKTVQDIPCFMGVTTTDLEPEGLYQVAADIEGTTRWSTAGVKEAEVLGQSGDTVDYYQYLDVPGWTLSNDRFWFLHGTTERNDGTIIFRWERLVEGGPYAERHQQVRSAHESAIEPPVNVGGWVFEPLENQTRIRYYICTDTGGAIPTSVQNMATTRTLPDTLGDCVREARKRAGG